MKIESERPEERNDLGRLRHMQADGIWGLVHERKIMRVDDVNRSPDGIIRGRVLSTEKVVDDNATIEYDTVNLGEVFVLFEDVSPRDRDRVIPGAELELQWGRGPGYRFFRVLVRRNILERARDPGPTGSVAR